MNILHIIDSGGMYGAETMLMHLMAEQKKMGLKPTLASIGLPKEPDKPIETLAKKKGFVVVPIRMRSGPNWIGAWRVLQHAHKVRIDILHSHGYKGDILFGLMPPFLRRIPMITTLHGWTSIDQMCGRVRLYEELDAFSLRFIDRIVLVNPSMKDHPMLEHLHPFKTIVIENGIPVSDTLPASLMRPDVQSFLSKKCSHLIAVGRLSPEKGFVSLLEAVAFLNRKGIDCQLVIFGEGSERGFLEKKIAELGLEEKAYMAGFVENVACVFPFFNAFVLSSLTEGLPMVLLEAMSAGTPIVATKVGGVPRLLAHGKGGMLVEPGNPLALGMALEQCVTDKQETKKKVEWAQRHVKEHYSSQVMADKYLGVYKELMDINPAFI